MDEERKRRELILEARQLVTASEQLLKAITNGDMIHELDLERIEEHTKLISSYLFK